ncbi:jg16498, partial [Pararge aegeria aegeria]
DGYSVIKPRTQASSTYRRRACWVLRMECLEGTAADEPLAGQRCLSLEVSNILGVRWQPAVQQKPTKALT